MRRASATARVAAVTIILATGGILATGCSSGAQGDWAERASGPAQASLPAGVTVFRPQERAAAPAIVGRTLSGVELDVADLRPRVVVLNAWASWCPPCLEEIPGLVTLSSSSRDDVEFVGLNVSDRQDSAAAVTEATGMTYPSIVDRSGAILATIPGVPPQSLPSTVVIDAEGRIAARIIGKLTPEILEPIIEYAAGR